MSDTLPPCPRILPSGIDGLVVTFADGFDDAANRAALVFRAEIERAGWPGVTETASSLVSTLLRFDPLDDTADALPDRLRALLDSRDWLGSGADAAPRLLTIPACFDPALAPQIDEAAEAAGFASRQAAIDSICAESLRVLTIGFAPGQPYIGQLPAAWDLPRQRHLTPHVPMGALGLAIRQMVLFAVPSRTGWRHVGQTAARLFAPDTGSPFLLSPGDALRFDPVSAAGLTRLQDDPTGGLRVETA